MALQVSDDSLFFGELGALLDIYEGVDPPDLSDADNLFSSAHDDFVALPPPPEAVAPNAPAPLPTHMLSEDCWHHVLLAAACDAQDMRGFAAAPASADDDLAAAAGTPRHGQIVDGVNVRVVPDGAAAGWRKVVGRHTEFFDAGGHGTAQETAHVRAVAQHLAPRLRDRDGRRVYDAPTALHAARHVFGTRVSVEALRKSSKRVATLCLINKSSYNAVRRFLFQPVMGEQTFAETAAEVASSRLLVHKEHVCAALPSVITHTPQTIALYVRRARVTHLPGRGFVESDEYAPASMLWALFAGVRLAIVTADSTSAPWRPQHAANAIKMVNRERNAHNSRSSRMVGARAPAALQPVNGFAIAFSPDNLGNPHRSLGDASLNYEFLTGDRNEWFDTSTVVQRVDSRAALVTLFHQRIARHRDRDIVQYRRAVAAGASSASHGRGPTSRPTDEDGKQLKQLDNAAVFAFECERTSFDVQRFLPAGAVQHAGRPVPFRLVVEFVARKGSLITRRLVGDPFYASARRLAQPTRDQVTRKRKASAALGAPP